MNSCEDIAVIFLETRMECGKVRTTVNNMTYCCNLLSNIKKRDNKIFTRHLNVLTAFGINK